MPRLTLQGGGAGSLYYYNHIHSADNDVYKCEGSSWAAAWKDEGAFYGYRPGPAGSLVTGTALSEARLYYSGYLGDHSKTRPGIRLGLKIKNPNNVTFDIYSHDLLEFNWSTEKFTVWDVATVSVIPRVNYQSVHTAGNNVWIQVSGPTDAKVGDTVTVSAYGELLYDTGLYDASLVRTESDGVTSTLISDTYVVGNEWGPVSATYPITHASEEKCTGTTQDTAYDPAHPPQSVDLTYSVGGSDSTPPQSRAEISPGPNANGWNNGSVSITLSATDPLGPPPDTYASGVGTFYYHIIESDRGVIEYSSSHPSTDTYSTTLSDDGVYTLLYYSIDNARNIEEEHTKTIRIDKANPSTEPGETIEPSVDIDGISTISGTTFTVNKPISDTGSGVDNVAVTITDSAGNVVASGNLSLSSGTALSGTWSGTIDLPAGISDGAVTRTQVVMDRSGNFVTTDTPMIIDRTPPAITADPLPSKWFNKPLDITFKAEDPSGVAWLRPDKVTLSAEGDNWFVSATASDSVGNITPPPGAKFGPYKLDFSKPIISDNGSGWYAAGPVKLVFTAKDGGNPPSGFAPDGSDTMIVDTINIPDPGFGQVSFNEYTRGPVNDLAGNASNQKTAQVGIDRAPPTVAYPIVNGSAVITITVIQKIPEGISKSDPVIMNWLNGFGAADVGVGLVAGQPPPDNDARNRTTFPVGTTVVIFTAKDRVGNTSEPLKGWVVVEPVRVNLSMLGNVSDKDEEDPGAYIGVNNDDDNGNDIADKGELKPLLDDKGKPVKDDDLSLLKMYISYWKEIKEGNLILKAQGSEHIKIWSVYQDGNDEKWTQIIGAGSATQKEWTPGQELPKELWIEGYEGSDSKEVILELWYATVTSDKVNVTVVGAEIKSIEFASDHEDSNGNNILRNADGKYKDEGTQYEEPEWVIDGPDPDKDPDRNNPITHNKNEKISLKVAVKINPAGIKFKLVGDGPNDYVNFSKDDLTSTGAEQEVTIMAKDKLPDKVVSIEKSIKWKIIRTDTQPNLEMVSVTSGPHRIFVLWGAPVTTNSFNRVNYLTFKRIDRITRNDVAGNENNINDIAKALQKWRDGANIDTSGVTTNNNNGSDYWELLDGTKKGQCAQGSILMEMASRLLGIPAEYQHVLPSVTTPILVHTASNPTSAPIRSHGLHGNETLYMYFEDSGNFTGWNVGEGCCMINGRLYAAWAGGIIGTVQGNRTAAHHILIQLEGDISGDLQRWRIDSSGGACGEMVPVPPIP